MSENHEKPNKWKFLMVLIPALLSAYATIMATWIQSTGAKESSVKVLVSQLNDQIIPHMQELVDELIKENTLLRERIAKMEGALDARREIRRDRINDNKEEKREYRRLPHILMQKVLK